MMFLVKIVLIIIAWLLAMPFSAVAGTSPSAGRHLCDTVFTVAGICFGTLPSAGSFNGIQPVSESYAPGSAYPASDSYSGLQSSAIRLQG